MQNQNYPAPSKKHASAAGAYAQNSQTHTPDQRELEARVLLKSAQRLKDLQDNWGQNTAEELDDALRYNRQLWLVFVDTAMEDEDENRTTELRNNIANLGTFIFKRTLEILASPQKELLDILIDINRDVAAGLMSQKSVETTPSND
jgi:flagellar protein FlaF